MIVLAGISYALKGHFQSTGVGKGVKENVGDIGALRDAARRTISPLPEFCDTQNRLHEVHLYRIKRQLAQ